MRVKKRCRYCPDIFTPDPRSYRPSLSGKGRRSVQAACPKPDCQAQRHRQADRRWHQNNPAYDDGREAYLRQWRRDHPGHSTDYRKSHPDYEEKNCQRQRERDRKKRNLGKQDAIERVHEEKLARIGRLINLGKQDAIRTPPTRISEEIRRYLRWSFHLGKQDVIVLQEKIAQNRAHEKPTTA